MKQSLSTPVVVGVVAVVLVIVALLFLRGVTAEPHTPRPDRSQFLKASDFKNPPPNLK